MARMMLQAWRNRWASPWPRRVRMHKMKGSRPWFTTSRIACMVTVLLSLEMVRAQAYGAAIFFMLLSGGMFLRLKWARFAMLCVLWFMVLWLPFVLNPFADAETTRSGYQPMPLERKVALVVVGEVVGLLLIHALQKDKANFE